MDKKALYESIMKDVAKIVKKRLNESQDEQITWEIIYKEVNRPRPNTTSYTGYKTREEVIEFFGLEEPDVEWYEIEQI